jgi:hypothetical protein
MAMSLWARVGAAVDAFRSWGDPLIATSNTLTNKYALLGSLYYGGWKSDPRYPWTGADANAYPGTRQLVKLTGAIVDLYAQMVWQGDLSTDGKPLPDGTKGALPIDPQTGSDTSDQQLLTAFGELYRIWNLRETLSLIPKTAAIYGDCLVQLVDDPDRGAVWLDVVRPNRVPDADLTLDYAGNVKAYAVEYGVTIPASKAFGKPVVGETYKFRREVDGETIRYYKDDKPFAYPQYGNQAVQRNIYGFVPAVWFRHERVAEANRGVGAYEKAVMQVLDLNQTLSSATDYQRKQFGAPVGVVGSSLRPGTTVSTSERGFTSQPTDADIEDVRRAAAERFKLLPMSDNGKFVTIDFDIGKTMQMVDFLYGRIIAEVPEAEWASKLFSLTQATGPGMERVLAPIKGKVDGVRQEHDPRIIAVLQMATSIIGQRLAQGDIPQELVTRRKQRYDAFRPFAPGAWDRGLMDATMPGRPVFPESNFEKAQWLSLADQYSHDWALQRQGISDEEIADANAADEDAKAQFQSALTGTPPAAGATGAARPTAPPGGGPPEAAGRTR